MSTVSGVSSGGGGAAASAPSGGASAPSGGASAPSGGASAPSGGASAPSGGSRDAGGAKGTSDPGGAKGTSDAGGAKGTSDSGNPQTDTTDKSSLSQDAQTNSNSDNGNFKGDNANLYNSLSENGQQAMKDWDAANPNANASDRDNALHMINSYDDAGLLNNGASNASLNADINGFNSFENDIQNSWDSNGMLKDNLGDTMCGAAYKQWAEGFNASNVSPFGGGNTGGGNGFLSDTMCGSAYEQWAEGFNASNVSPFGGGNTVGGNGFLSDTMCGSAYEQWAKNFNPSNNCPFLNKTSKTQMLAVSDFYLKPEFFESI